MIGDVGTQVISAQPGQAQVGRPPSALACADRSCMQAKCGSLWGATAANQNADERRKGEDLCVQDVIVDPACLVDASQGPRGHFKIEHALKRRREDLLRLDVWIPLPKRSAGSGSQRSVTPTSVHTHDSRIEYTEKRWRIFRWHHTHYCHLQTPRPSRTGCARSRSAGRRITLQKQDDAPQLSLWWRETRGTQPIIWCFHDVPRAERRAAQSRDSPRSVLAGRAERPAATATFSIP